VVQPPPEAPPPVPPELLLEAAVPLPVVAVVVPLLPAPPAPVAPALELLLVAPALELLVVELLVVELVELLLVELLLLLELAVEPPEPAKMGSPPAPLELAVVEAPSEVLPPCPAVSPEATDEAQPAVARPATTSTEVTCNRREIAMLNLAPVSGTGDLWE